MSTSLVSTFHLSNACVLRAEKPIAGTSAGSRDCLLRELILVTGCVGKKSGVPDGLYVFNANTKVRSSAPDSSSTPVQFTQDTDVIRFLQNAANFNLVHSRCSIVPGTMPPDTPKSSPKKRNAIGGSWSMVDFIPLFSIINMESERERSARLSRVAREASAWDQTLREYKTTYKPKMSIPHTPSARMAKGGDALGSCAGGCSSAESPPDDVDKVLPPLKFTLDSALPCEGASKSVVDATRFFITFQHPEEIKSETPSILSLVLIGHTEDAPQSPPTMACARSMLDLEFLMIKAIYGSCVRSPDDTITKEFVTEDGVLSLCVHMPKWRIVSFVSPASGKGEAVHTWTVTILPVLYCGRFSTYGIVTTRRGHAEDIVAESMPAEGKKGKLIFDEHDILVSVGGDGVAHEICNGLSRRNNFVSLPLQTYPKCDKDTEHCSKISLQDKVDAEDPEQQDAIKHAQAIWADVPLENPTGYYAVPDDLLARTPYVALVAAGSGCALAKEVEVENFIVSALSLLHLRPQAIDIYRMDPFDIPQSTIKASDAKYIKTAEDKSAIKIRNSIEGSATFAKASETPVRFGMLALMFAAVNEVDKGSEGMRWMGNTRFTVKTIAMIMSGVPLYRVYFRYSSDKFYQPDVTALKRNHQFGRSFAQSGAPSQCTDWQLSPNFRVAFMSLNNVRYVARDVIFGPYARPSDGFIDSLFVGAAEYGSSDPSYKMKVRRRDAIDFFTQTETGAHVDDNKVTYGKCRRVQILPIDGNVMADGEVMNKTGITVSCVRKALVILASPSMNWEN